MNPTHYLEITSRRFNDAINDVRKKWGFPPTRFTIAINEYQDQMR
jgi:hypothetical protein